MYRLIIFDFDGTLADTSQWFIEALPALALSHGFRAPDRLEIERLRGRPIRETLAQLEISAWRLPAIARELRVRAIKDAHRLKLFAGVSDVLASLSGAGATLAIVSSNAENAVRTVLADDAERFKRFACGASLFGKARNIRKIMRASGVDASDTVYVGDELRDIAAARGAGVAAALVTWGFARLEDPCQHGADHLVHEPSALMELVSACPALA